MLRNLLISLCLLFLCSFRSFAQTINDYNIFGGGPFCQGTNGSPIWLDGSQNGIAYELVFNDSFSVVSNVPSNGDTIYFGHYAVDGSYTIVGHDTVNNVTDTMTGSVFISMVLRPSVFNIAGGGNLCEGDAGIPITLSGSQSNIFYDLFLDDTLLINTFSGSGTSLLFGNYNLDGRFTIIARRNTLPNCPINMNGNATINVYPHPEAFNLLGNGVFCSGSLGTSLYLDGSELNINYSLRNASDVVVDMQNGTGDTIQFSPIALASIYHVEASRTEVLGCTSTMNSTITVTPLTQTVYTVSGGGIFCEESAGGVVILSGSQTGFEYFLDNPLIDPVPIPVLGTGGALVFDSILVEGVYSVSSRHISDPQCELAMASSATFTYQALPLPFPLTGGGYYCEGQQGVEIGLDSSETNVQYELILNNSLPSGIIQTGTGDSLGMGLVSLSGFYRVEASINGCGIRFDDSVEVSITDCTFLEESTPMASYQINDNKLVFGKTQSEIVLLDLSGRCFLVAENASEIDFTPFSTGIYIVQVNKNISLKLIRP